MRKDIQWSYKSIPKCERPLWATAVLCFYGMLPEDVSIDNLPYDFGIYNDIEVMRMSRIDGKVPFDFAPGFEDRMFERYENMFMQESRESNMRQRGRPQPI